MANEKVETPQPTRYTCPHLGLDIDRTVMLSEPTPAHRCFARKAVGAPGVGHQQQFCLATHHTVCPHYVEPAVTNVAENTFNPLMATSLASVGQPDVWRAPAQAGARRGRKWLLPATLGSLALVLFVVLASQVDSLFVRATPNTASVAVALTESGTPLAAPLVLTGTLPAVGGAAANPNAPPTPTETPTPGPGQLIVLLPSVTPEPLVTTLTLLPKAGNVSWWSSDDTQPGHIDDSFLYAGYREGQTYLAALRFDLNKIARGAEIRSLQLRLTGLRTDRFVADPNTIWSVEVLADKALDALAGRDFMTVFSAPSSLTLRPLRANELAQGQANVLDFDPLARAWLEQQLLNGATAVTLRIKADTQGVDTLFGWDSGFGAETGGNPPTLDFALGPPPPTPPPLPTKQVIVATATPIPTNVLTVVAQNQTATYVATTIGAYTPIPWDVVTPTPIPANLATLQAIALAQGLPAVVPHTPTPANNATAAFVVAIATAVAQTTGTYTPVPTGYVTPMLIYPSPPPENILTAVARQTEVARAESIATPTPIPFPGILAEYVIATVTPENVLTAAVMVAEATAAAQTAGTPQPTPWNRVVLLPTTLPVTPSATPTAPIEVLSLTLTPTPTPTLLPPLDGLPAELWNHILFKTTRNGSEETFAVNMATYQLARINDSRIYELARDLLPYSPDGQSMTIVEADENRLLQIKTYSFEYKNTRQLTAFGPNPMRSEPASYDPAWSPDGRLIVFVTNNTGNDEIFTVDPEGTTLTQLTFNRTEWDKHPSWSPDGSQIVFYSNRDIGVRRLWVMNADGGGQQQLSSLLQPAAANLDYEDWDPIWVR